VIRSTRSLWATRYSRAFRPATSSVRREVTVPLRLAAYVSATRSSSFATCGKSAMRYAFTSGSTITETRVDGSRCADAEVARTVFCQSSGARNTKPVPPTS
jgi:hypothetical protein